jgi:hypothetical protein
MILLYTLLVAVLGVAVWLVRRRVAALERTYVRAAQAADAALKEATTKPGNSGKADVYLAAKHQYQLGRLVQRREEVEQRYVAWQQFADRFGHTLARVRGWKGRKLPYSFGMLDVAGLLYVVDYLGVGQYVSVRRLIELAQIVWSG